MIVDSLGGSAYGLKVSTGYPGGNAQSTASAGNLNDEHPRFVVQANGNGGVGTASPQALLHMDGAQDNQWGMIVNSLGGSAYGLKISTGYPGERPICVASAGNL